MTWTETISPTFPPDSAPASTAARTAATSPRMVIATNPLPTLCCSTNCTLAAFRAASSASTAATMPLVSINPIASAFAITVLRKNLICVQNSFCLQCDDEFFVGGDNPDFAGGFELANPLFPAARLVFLRVENEAGKVEVFADELAQRGRVFAHPAGEGEHVTSSEDNQ